MGEQRVAEQHRRRWSKFPRRSPPTATDIGLIHDVIVDERGEVHEFDNRGDSHEVRRDRPRTTPTAQKHEGGPNAFTRRINAIISHPPNLRLERSHLSSQKPIELGHVRSEQSKYGGKRVRSGNGGRHGDAAHELREARSFF